MGEQQCWSSIFGGKSRKFGSLFWGGGDVCAEQVGSASGGVMILGWRGSGLADLSPLSCSKSPDPKLFPPGCGICPSPGLGSCSVLSLPGKWDNKGKFLTFQGVCSNLGFSPPSLGAPFDAAAALTLPSPALSTETAPKILSPSHFPCLKANGAAGSCWRIFQWVGMRGGDGKKGKLQAWIWGWFFLSCSQEYPGTTETPAELCLAGNIPGGAQPSQISCIWRDKVL